MSRYHTEKWLCIQHTTKQLIESTMRKHENPIYQQIFPVLQLKTSNNHWLWMRVRLVLRARHLHENETQGNENESKGVQFPAVKMSPIKFREAANRQSPEYHRNTRLGCVLTNAISRNNYARFGNISV